MTDGKDWVGDVHTGSKQVPLLPTPPPILLVRATFFVRFSVLKDCWEEKESNIHLSFDLPILHAYGGKNFEPCTKKESNYMLLYVLKQNI